MKSTVLCGVFIVIAAALSAQTSPHRTTPPRPPNTTAPTKVTGDGVKTETGLQYWDIKVGTGEEAKSGDKVKVHYTGWFTSGKKFDSSVDAHQLYSGTLGHGNVIKG